ncbi:hypothetical protein HNQ38_002012 [Desulfovibrio intestinalis]|uniref:Uncharacterized protein n=1 Tax=Desulfovibrio intestinalis TaxID=58621 RepID=A0A7W8FHI6_9BACT|nr:hypothetical protein [Desulfovibrio intestinalis]
MKLMHLGLSRDGRTNRWKIICACSAEILPPTTICATQQVECNKCGAIISADYNAQTVTLVRDGEEHQPCPS